MYVRPAGEGPAKDDPEQTRAGIEIALKPWAYKVSRFTRSVTPEQVAKELLGRPPSGT